MMTLADLRRRAEHAYTDYLQAWLRGEPYQPVRIGGLGDSLQTIPHERAEWLAQLRNNSKSALGYGYTVELKTRNTRATATQSIVRSVAFESSSDLLLFLEKTAEFEDFVEDVERLRSELPELSTWPERNWKQIIIHAGRWLQLLEVCLFFKNNPRPVLHLRELPISSDTKFVESHSVVLISLLDALLPDIPNPAERDFARRYGLLADEPRIRFRWLDLASAQAVTGGYTDLSVLQSEFTNKPLPCRTVLVVENKTNLLAMEKTLRAVHLTEAIAVFGGGFGVARLRDAAWLHDRKLLYWGDLDVHGFQILSQMRGYFPHTQAVLMDRKTFDACQDMSVRGELTQVATLPNLSPVEREMFMFLKENNLRLEQEKIPSDIARLALMPTK